MDKPLPTLRPINSSKIKTQLYYLFMATLVIAPGGLILLTQS